MPTPGPVDPVRRRLVLGALAAPVAAAVLPAAAAAARAVAPAVAPAAAPPECLADLIASGEVTRADLVAR
ncbi:hypothetical protein [Nocardioides litoris]|uniref:hypothetical protein n=1 Tax=Nocardioides litoris TaxID=1926648 RepID=UPI00111D4A36|nr:hypothetical protein [Nocardioides litoris]